MGKFGLWYRPAEGAGQRELANLPLLFQVEQRGGVTATSLTLWLLKRCQIMYLNTLAPGLQACLEIFMQVEKLQ